MSNNTKQPYAKVSPVADHIVSVLSQYCQRIEVAGSLRRQRPMIGDIEIVAIPNYQNNLLGETDYAMPTALDSFLSEKLGDNLTKNGSKYKSFNYGIYKVDLFLATPANFGNIYTIRTGSSDFSRWLVTSRVKGGAMPFGFRQKDGYLWHGEKRIDCPDETDLFNAIGLPFVPLNMRDDGKWNEVVNV